MRKRIGLLGVLIAVLALLVAPVVNAQTPTGRMLVWLADGSSPNQVGASEPGQLVLMDPTGATTPVGVDIPQGTARIFPCAGDQAKSPDGRLFTFYIGGDEGEIYQMNGANVPPVKVDDVRAITCLGGGTFQYSPDGNRLAYIDFEPSAGDDEFSDGRMRILNTADLTRVNIRENDIVDTAAFDITNEQIAFIRLPQSGNRNEALEGVVNLFNGTAVLPVATLRPNKDNNCRFTSASIKILPTGQLLALMGERCRSGDNTSTTWKIFQIDTSARDSFRELVGDNSPGQFAPLSRTNTLLLSGDGSRLFFTIPDGITANTVSLNALDLATSSSTQLLPNYAVFPKFISRQYSWDEPSFPVMSPNRRWLAIVQNTADDDATLQIFDVSNSAAAPITLPAPNRGDAITSVQFTPDSSRLVYVQGGHSSNENTLNMVELETTAQVTISRGRFGAVVLSPDGAQVAAMEWQTVEDPQQPPYLSFAILDIATSAYIPVWSEGAVITPEGKVTEQKFVYPLAWING
jgi:hypothetical protein